MGLNKDAEKRFPDVGDKIAQIDIKMPKLLLKPNIPDVLKKEPKANATSRIKALQEVADAFRPLLASNTFASYIFQEPGEAVEDYAAFLLQAEREIYVYCAQRNIVAQIQSGHYLLESIEHIMKETTQFEKRKASQRMQKFYASTMNLLQTEMDARAVNKEKAFTIIYDALLILHNCITQTTEGTVDLCSANINLKKLLENIEKHYCSKSTFEKKYRQAILHIKTKPQEQSNAIKNDILMYYSFTYFERAAKLAYARIKELEML